jgi:hypothetical protein
MEITWGTAMAGEGDKSGTARTVRIARAPTMVCGSRESGVGEVVLVRSIPSTPKAAGLTTLLILACMYFRRISSRRGSLSKYDTNSYHCNNQPSVSQRFYLRKKLLLAKYEKIM